MPRHAAGTAGKLVLRGSQGNSGFAMIARRLSTNTRQDWYTSKVDSNDNATVMGENIWRSAVTRFGNIQTRTAYPERVRHVGVAMRGSARPSYKNTTDLADGYYMNLHGGFNSMKKPGGRHTSSSTPEEPGTLTREAIEASSKIVKPDGKIVYHACVGEVAATDLHAARRNSKQAITKPDQVIIYVDATQTGVTLADNENVPGLLQQIVQAEKITKDNVLEISTHFAGPVIYDIGGDLLKVTGVRMVDGKCMRTVEKLPKDSRDGFKIIENVVIPKPSSDFLASGLLQSFMFKEHNRGLHGRDGPLPILKARDAIDEVKAFVGAIKNTDDKLTSLNEFFVTSILEHTDDNHLMLTEILGCKKLTDAMDDRDLKAAYIMTKHGARMSAQELLTNSTIGRLGIKSSEVETFQRRLKIINKELLNVLKSKKIDPKKIKLHRLYDDAVTKGRVKLSAFSNPNPAFIKGGRPILFRAAHRVEKRIQAGGAGFEEGLRIRVGPKLGLTKVREAPNGDKTLEWKSFVRSRFLRPITKEYTRSDGTTYRSVKSMSHSPAAQRFMRNLPGFFKEGSDGKMHRKKVSHSAGAQMVMRKVPGFKEGTDGKMHRKNLFHSPLITKKVPGENGEMTYKVKKFSHSPAAKNIQANLAHAKEKFVRAAPRVMKKTYEGPDGKTITKMKWLHPERKAKAMGKGANQFAKQALSVLTKPSSNPEKEGRPVWAPVTAAQSAMKLGTSKDGKVSGLHHMFRSIDKWGQNLYGRQERKKAADESRKSQPSQRPPSRGYNLYEGPSGSHEDDMRELNEQRGRDDAQKWRESVVRWRGALAQEAYKPLSVDQKKWEELESYPKTIDQYMSPYMVNDSGYMVDDSGEASFSGTSAMIELDVNTGVLDDQSSLGRTHAATVAFSSRYRAAPRALKATTSSGNRNVLRRIVEEAKAQEANIPTGELITDAMVLEAVKNDDIVLLLRYIRHGLEITPAKAGDWIEAAKNVPKNAMKEWPPSIAFKDMESFIDAARHNAKNQGEEGFIPEHLGYLPEEVAQFFLDVRAEGRYTPVSMVTRSSREKRFERACQRLASKTGGENGVVDLSTLAVSYEKDKKGADIGKKEHVKLHFLDSLVSDPSVADYDFLDYVLFKTGTFLNVQDVDGLHILHRLAREGNIKAIEGLWHQGYLDTTLPLMGHDAYLHNGVQHLLQQATLGKQKPLRAYGMSLYEGGGEDYEHINCLHTSISQGQQAVSDGLISRFGMLAQNSESFEKKLVKVDLDASKQLLSANLKKVFKEPKAGFFSKRKSQRFQVTAASYDHLFNKTPDSQNYFPTYQHSVYEWLTEHVKEKATQFGLAGVVDQYDIKEIINFIRIERPDLVNDEEKLGSFILQSLAQLSQEEEGNKEKDWLRQMMRGDSASLMRLLDEAPALPQEVVFKRFQDAIICNEVEVVSAIIERYSDIFTQYQITDHVSDPLVKALQSAWHIGNEKIIGTAKKTGALGAPGNWKDSLPEVSNEQIRDCVEQLKMSEEIFTLTLENSVDKQQAIENHQASVKAILVNAGIHPDRGFLEALNSKRCKEPDLDGREFRLSHYLIKNSCWHLIKEFGLKIKNEDATLILHIGGADAVQQFLEGKTFRFSKEQVALLIKEACDTGKLDKKFLPYIKKDSLPDRYIAALIEHGCVDIAERLVDAGKNKNKPMGVKVFYALAKTNSKGSRRYSEERNPAMVRRKFRNMFELIREIEGDLNDIKKILDKPESFDPYPEMIKQRTHELDMLARNANAWKTIQNPEKRAGLLSKIKLLKDMQEHHKKVVQANYTFAFLKEQAEDAFAEKHNEWELGGLQFGFHEGTENYKEVERVYAAQKECLEYVKDSLQDSLNFITKLVDYDDFHKFLNKGWIKEPETVNELAALRKLATGSYEKVEKTKAAKKNDSLMGLLLRADIISEKREGSYDKGSAEKLLQDSGTVILEGSSTRPEVDYEAWKKSTQDLNDNVRTKKKDATNAEKTSGSSVSGPVQRKFPIYRPSKEPTRKPQPTTQTAPPTPVSVDSTAKLDKLYAIFSEMDSAVSGNKTSLNGYSDVEIYHLINMSLKDRSDIGLVYPRFSGSAVPKSELKKLKEGNYEKVLVPLKVGDNWVLAVLQPNRPAFVLDSAETPTTQSVYNTSLKSLYKKLYDSSLTSIEVVSCKQQESRAESGGFVCENARAIIELGEGEVLENKEAALRLMKDIDIDANQLHAFHTSFIEEHVDDVVANMVALLDVMKGRAISDVQSMKIDGWLEELLVLQPESSSGLNSHAPVKPVQEGKSLAARIPSLSLTELDEILQEKVKLAKGVVEGFIQGNGLLRDGSKINVDFLSAIRDEARGKETCLHFYSTEEVTHLISQPLSGVHYAGFASLTDERLQEGVNTLYDSALEFPLGTDKHQDLANHERIIQSLHVELVGQTPHIITIMLQKDGPAIVLDPMGNEVTYQEKGLPNRVAAYIYACYDKLAWGAPKILYSATKQQHDDHSCGAWSVENVRVMAEAGKIESQEQLDQLAQGVFSHFEKGLLGSTPEDSIAYKHLQAFLVATDTVIDEAITYLSEEGRVSELVEENISDIQQNIARLTKENKDTTAQTNNLKTAQELQRTLRDQLEANLGVLRQAKAHGDDQEIRPKAPVKAGAPKAAETERALSDAYAQLDIALNIHDVLHSFVKNGVGKSADEAGESVSATKAWRDTLKKIKQGDGNQLTGCNDLLVEVRQSIEALLKQQPPKASKDYKDFVKSLEEKLKQGNSFWNDDDAAATLLANLRCLKALEMTYDFIMGRPPHNKILTRGPVEDLYHCENPEAVEGSEKKLLDKILKNPENDLKTLADRVRTSLSKQGGVIDDKTKDKNEKIEKWANDLDKRAADLGNAKAAKRVEEHEQREQARKKAAERVQHAKGQREKFSALIKVLSHCGDEERKKLIEQATEDKQWFLEQLIKNPQLKKKNPDVYEELWGVVLSSYQKTDYALPAGGDVGKELLKVKQTFATNDGNQGIVAQLLKEAANLGNEDAKAEIEQQQRREALTSLIKDCDKQPVEKMTTDLLALMDVGSAARLTLVEVIEHPELLLLKKRSPLSYMQLLGRLIDMCNDEQLYSDMRALDNGKHGVKHALYNLAMETLSLNIDEGLQGEQGKPSDAGDVDPKAVRFKVVVNIMARSALLNVVALEQSLSGKSKSKAPKDTKGAEETKAAKAAKEAKEAWHQSGLTDQALLWLNENTTKLDREKLIDLQDLAAVEQRIKLSLGEQLDGKSLLPSVKKHLEEKFNNTEDKKVATSKKKELTPQEKAENAFAKGLLYCAYEYLSADYEQEVRNIEDLTTAIQRAKLETSRQINAIIQKVGIGRLRSVELSSGTSSGDFRKRCEKQYELLTKKNQDLAEKNGGSLTEEAVEAFYHELVALQEEFDGLTANKSAKQRDKGIANKTKGVTETLAKLRSKKVFKNLEEIRENSKEEYRTSSMDDLETRKREEGEKLVNKEKAGLEAHLKRNYLLSYMHMHMADMYYEQLSADAKKGLDELLESYSTNYLCPKADTDKLLEKLNESLLQAFVGETDKVVGLGDEAIKSLKEDAEKLAGSAAKTMAEFKKMGWAEKDKDVRLSKSIAQVQGRIKDANLDCETIADSFATYADSSLKEHKGLTDRQRKILRSATKRFSDAVKCIDNKADGVVRAGQIKAHAQKHLLDTLNQLMKPDDKEAKPDDKQLASLEQLKDDWQKKIDGYVSLDMTTCFKLQVTIMSYRKSPVAIVSKSGGVEEPGQESTVVSDSGGGRVNRFPKYKNKKSPEQGEEVTASNDNNAEMVATTTAQNVEDLIEFLDGVRERERSKGEKQPAALARTMKMTSQGQWNAFEPKYKEEVQQAFEAFKNAVAAGSESSPPNYDEFDKAWDIFKAKLEGIQKSLGSTEKGGGLAAEDIKNIKDQFFRCDAVNPITQKAPSVEAILKNLKNMHVFGLLEKSLAAVTKDSSVVKGAIEGLKDLSESLKDPSDGEKNATQAKFAKLKKELFDGLDELKDATAATSAEKEKKEQSKQKKKKEIHTNKPKVKINYELLYKDCQLLGHFLQDELPELDRDLDAELIKLQKEKEAKKKQKEKEKANEEPAGRGGLLAAIRDAGAQKAEEANEKQAGPGNLLAEIKAAAAQKTGEKPVEGGKNSTTHNGTDLNGRIREIKKVQKAREGLKALAAILLVEKRSDLKEILLSSSADEDKDKKKEAIEKLSDEVQKEYERFREEIIGELDTLNVEVTRLRKKREKSNSDISIFTGFLKHIEEAKQSILSAKSSKEGGATPTLVRLKGALEELNEECGKIKGNLEKAGEKASDELKEDITAFEKWAKGTARIVKDSKSAVDYLEKATLLNSHQLAYFKTSLLDELFNVKYLNVIKPAQPGSAKAGVDSVGAMDDADKEKQVKLYSLYLQQHKARIAQNTMLLMSLKRQIKECEAGQVDKTKDVQDVEENVEKKKAVPYQWFEADVVEGSFSDVTSSVASLKNSYGELKGNMEALLGANDQGAGFMQVSPYNKIRKDNKTIDMDKFDGLYQELSLFTPKSEDELSPTDALKFVDYTLQHALKRGASNHQGPAYVIKPLALSSLEGGKIELEYYYHKGVVSSLAGNSVLVPVQLRTGDWITVKVTNQRYVEIYDAQGADWNFSMMGELKTTQREMKRWSQYLNSLLNENKHADLSGIEKVPEETEAIFSVSDIGEKIVNPDAIFSKQVALINHPKIAAFFEKHLSHNELKAFAEFKDKVVKVKNEFESAVKEAEQSNLDNKIDVYHAVIAIRKSKMGAVQESEREVCLIGGSTKKPTSNKNRGSSLFASMHLLQQLHKRASHKESDATKDKKEGEENEKPVAKKIKADRTKEEERRSAINALLESERSTFENKDLLHAQQMQRMAHELAAMFASFRKKVLNPLSVDMQKALRNVSLSQEKLTNMAPVNKAQYVYGNTEDIKLRMEKVEACQQTFDALEENLSLSEPTLWQQKTSQDLVIKCVKALEVLMIDSSVDEHKDLVGRLTEWKALQAMQGTNRFNVQPVQKTQGPFLSFDFDSMILNSDEGQPLFNAQFSAVLENLNSLKQQGIPCAVISISNRPIGAIKALRELDTTQIRGLKNALKQSKEDEDSLKEISKRYGFSLPLLKKFHAFIHQSPDEEEIRAGELVDYLSKLQAFFCKGKPVELLTGVNKPFVKNLQEMLAFDRAPTEQEKDDYEAALHEREIAQAPYAEYYKKATGNNAESLTQLLTEANSRRCTHSTNGMSEPSKFTEALANRHIGKQSYYHFAAESGLDPSLDGKMVENIKAKYSHLDCHYVSFGKVNELEKKRESKVSASVVSTEVDAQGLIAKIRGGHVKAIALQAVSGLKPEVVGSDSQNTHSRSEEVKTPSVQGHASKKNHAK